MASKPKSNRILFSEKNGSKPPPENCWFGPFAVHEDAVLYSWDRDQLFDDFDRCSCSVRPRESRGGKPQLIISGPPSSNLANCKAAALAIIAKNVEEKIKNPKTLEKGNSDPPNPTTRRQDSWPGARAKSQPTHCHQDKQNTCDQFTKLRETSTASSSTRQAQQAPPPRWSLAMGSFDMSGAATHCENASQQWTAQQWEHYQWMAQWQVHHAWGQAQQQQPWGPAQQQQLQEPWRREEAEDAWTFQHDGGCGSNEEAVMEDEKTRDPHLKRTLTPPKQTEEKNVQANLEKNPTENKKRPGEPWICDVS